MGTMTMAMIALLLAPTAAAGKQLKVIGAGMGRTGTDSLRTALNELGFKTYHMCELLGICNEGGTRAPSPLEMLGFEGGHNELWAEVNRNITAGVEPDFSFLTEEFNAAVDFPSAAFWPELLKAYPKAKVVLTVRDPHKLYKSISNAWCHIIGAGTLLDQAVTEITFNRPWGRWNRAMQIEWAKATGRLVGVPGFTWVQACNDEAYAVEGLQGVGREGEGDRARRSAPHLRDGQARLHGAGGLPRSEGADDAVPAHELHRRVHLRPLHLPLPRAADGRRARSARVLLPALLPAARARRRQAEDEARVERRAPARPTDPTDQPTRLQSMPGRFDSYSLFSSRRARAARPIHTCTRVRT